jgi:hypothetical protein
MTDEIQESYRTLELKEGASPEAVKEAYRSLVKVWHPDRFGDDEKLRRRADEKLKQINRAYDLLKDHRPPRAQGTETHDNRASREASSADGASGSSRRNRPAPRGVHVPHAKLQRAPNMTHARLGCLLVGGVSAVLLILILIGLFYDDSLSGRRTVALTPPTPGAEVAADPEDTKDDARAEDAPESEVAPRGGTPVEAVAIEADLAAAEARARQAARATVNESPGRTAVGSGRDPLEFQTKAGDRSFLSRQFYKNGMGHLNSRGGPREDAKAVEWFRRASQRGHAGAQRMLAGLLREGRGVETDRDRALFWILVAAGQGDGEAKREIPRFEEGMDASRRATARTMAAAELRRLRE